MDARDGLTGMRGEAGSLGRTWPRYEVQRCEDLVWGLRSSPQGNARRFHRSNRGHGASCKASSNSTRAGKRSARSFRDSMRAKKRLSSSRAASFRGGNRSIDAKTGIARTETRTRDAFFASIRGPNRFRRTVLNSSRGKTKGSGLQKASIGAKKCSGERWRRGTKRKTPPRPRFWARIEVDDHRPPYISGSRRGFFGRNRR